MDSRVRARVLLAEATALGVTIDDLIAAAAETGLRRDCPTVADYVATVAPSFAEATAGTYMSYWRLAVARFGERRLDEISPDDCEVLLRDAVARAKARRPTSDGRSSRENCVGALRALFDRAERSGHVSTNPAARVEKPRRTPNRRRALDEIELGEVVDAVRATSRDPDLDLLLVRFQLESGARREGALNLRLRDLDDRRATARLNEKFDKEREQPISPTLLSALEASARDRGGLRPEDAVFARGAGGSGERPADRSDDNPRGCQPIIEPGRRG